MKVERNYGDKNKTIYCHVPALLPGRFLQSEPKWAFAPGLSRQYGSFSLQAFMARYMAGNRSLREARKVSRKRLALVGSECGYLDPEAYELHRQINRFVKAVAVCHRSERMTQGAVSACNKTIAEELDTTGALRQTQNWVGGNNPFEARYVCPPPELVPELLDNWFDFVNNETTEACFRAIVGHCQLVSIHPFVEGNGRTARAVMEAMVSKALGDRIPLMLYRLSPDYVAGSYTQMQELFNVGDPQAITHEFWERAVLWSNRLLQSIQTILEDTRQEIAGRIGLSRFSKVSALLMDHLWRQPIVSHQLLPKWFAGDIGQIQTGLSELSAVGLIEQRRLREPRNTVIFDSPIIFAAYAAMDEAVFEPYVV